MAEARLLVTGASGFVGRAVVERCVADPRWRVRAAVRGNAAVIPEGAQAAHVGDIGPDTDWRDTLDRVDVVVHAAARVHMMSDAAADPLDAFRRVNVAGTLNLARQAATAGARRLVFISSIKVNGEATHARPYTAADVPAPLDPYGVSKHEAEEGLRALARETSLEVAIIRPVLVYGPGVKANFLSMMRWLHRGIPLPLGAIHNRRSLVALDNLVDLIHTCLDHPAAANETFLVSDGEDLSTTALLERTALALGARAHLLPVPPQLLAAAARALGKADLARRLCGSLQVDIAKTRERLGWNPPSTVDAALKHTARDFLQSLDRP
jgi:nucleoside-diphosphate-sugar epimerase